jgi:hypothetical protein
MVAVSVAISLFHVQSYSPVDMQDSAISQTSCSRSGDSSQTPSHSASRSEMLRSQLHALKKEWGLGVCLVSVRCCLGRFTPVLCRSTKKSVLKRKQRKLTMQAAFHRMRRFLQTLACVWLFPVQVSFSMMFLKLFPSDGYVVSCVQLSLPILH